MGLLDGKVAFVTGAARGQGRSHAITLAKEGASIIAIDINGPVTSDNGYPASTPEDMAETVRLVEATNQHIVHRQADVRDSAAMESVLAEGVAEFGGRLDIVVANAGISNWNRFWEMPDDQWQVMIDVNLTGVWRTLKAAVPIMIDAGNGGSLIAISSSSGIKSLPAQAHYAAAKHGVTGLTKTAAIELGEYGIRVNSIHPWSVVGAMGQDTTMSAILDKHPEYRASFASMLPDLRSADPLDISNAVVWLASDLSRAVTATQLTVDMGATKM